MTASDDLRRLIKEAHERSGVGVLAFEQSLGLKPSSLKAIISDNHKQSPSIGKAETIAEALGLEFYIGLKRTSELDKVCAALEIPLNSTSDQVLAAIRRSTVNGPSAEAIKAAVSEAVDLKFKETSRGSIEPTALDDSLTHNEIFELSRKIREESRKNGTEETLEEHIQSVVDAARSRNIYG